MNTKPLSLVVLISIAFLSGCGSGGKVAAVVNGQVITEREIVQRMARLNPQYRSALGGDQKRLLEEMVMETVLLQEARRRGLEHDPEVDRLVKEARRQILLGRLLETIRQSKQVQVPDEDVKKIYEANKSNFMEPETFRASHILVADEETAKKAMERLKSGESFAKVAGELSTDPSSKTKGGDIGYFAKGQLIPEFEAACESLKPGELSGIVKTQLGYHIIQLTDKKSVHQRPLEEVQDQIRRQLGAQQQQRQVESSVQELRAKAQVQIKDSGAAPVSPVAPAAQRQPAAVAPKSPNS